LPKKWAACGSPPFVDTPNRRKHHRYNVPFRQNVDDPPLETVRNNSHPSRLNPTGVQMSKDKPLPVDPLHQQQSGAPGVDQDDAQIEKPKDDAFKKPANGKAPERAVKKG